MMGCKLTAEQLLVKDRSNRNKMVLGCSSIKNKCDRIESYIKNKRWLKPPFVRLIGLEPTRRKTLDPKSSASTNFATSAR